jgi:hypothetical protein
MNAGAAYLLVEGEEDTVELMAAAAQVEDNGAEELENDGFVFDFGLFGLDADFGPFGADVLEWDFVSGCDLGAVDIFIDVSSAEVEKDIFLQKNSSKYSNKS